MKHIKLVVSLFGALFIVGLLGLNMYSSTSLPGFSSNAGCYHCHNDIALVYNDSGNLPSWNATTEWPETSWFSARQDWSINYVPMNPVAGTGNMDTNYIEFTKVIFATNATHFTMLVRLNFDPLVNSTGSTDKFAFIFNIDVENFTMGQFKDNNAMKFDNGHADLWFWDAGDVAPNSTGMASDMFINSSHYQDTPDSQDITVDVSHSSSFGGYYLQFTRNRTTSDPNDVQFVDGALIKYGLAYWNGSGFSSHYSSFDKALVIGRDIQDVVTLPALTETETEIETDTVTDTTTKVNTITITTGTASAFTLVVAITTFIAIPVIFRFKRK